MKYQWLKDDEEPLSDSEDYKGCTTQELIIVGTGPQVKGNYMCLVKHEYGEIQSSVIHYGKFYVISQKACFGYTLVLKCYHIPDPFVFELTSNGMSKKVIAKLLGRF